ncbi:uncharacterized protein LOC123557009 [Mercenaria mercenaria]|uniref:uncharacterized protein LOC123557009 n=1 Tax=Mercenaria mercenaria TaxID=6596 RepID=UPI00234E4B38|nr:uncharacterized protein LOC123557009 [Mercenaria mercenaria]
MHVLLGITAFVCVYILSHKVSCQCSFGTTFASTTWHDNTKGALTFTATGITGWAFTSTRTSGVTIISSWQCVNHTDNTYLVLRTSNTFSFQPSSSTTSIQVYAYLCLKLTTVTGNSFIYYQPQVQEINLGGERLKVSALSTLYQTDVCDSTVSVPTTEYHVLVKSGSEASAAIQCPDSLLFVVDFTYYGNDGSSACTGSGDRLDVCTDKTQMTITTNTCTQEIAFSAGGQFYCVATVSSNGYDYTTVYNRDASISSTTNRFACLSSIDTDISVAPGNCTAYQTPFTFPLEADQSTKTGHRLVVTEEYGKYTKNVCLVNVTFLVHYDYRCLNFIRSK